MRKRQNEIEWGACCSDQRLGTRTKNDWCTEQTKICHQLGRMKLQKMWCGDQKSGAQTMKMGELAKTSFVGAAPKLNETAELRQNL